MKYSEYGMRCMIECMKTIIDYKYQLDEQSCKIDYKKMGG